MAGLVENLAIVQKFLQVLTWRKNVQFLVFILIAGLAYATFENRESIYNFASQAKIAADPPLAKKISKQITDKIDTAVNKSDLIIGIQITIVDFQKNTRFVIYTSIDDVDLKNIFVRFTDNTIAELPLFNSDVNNNKRLVGLINGEYICNPFIDTIGAKLMPDATKYITTVCANGIPPYYGKFSGIVSVYTRRQPTSEEVDQIRTLSRLLSTEIYERNFK